MSSSERHSATIRRNIRALAEEEMAKWLPMERWSFAWNRRRTSLGVCKWWPAEGRGEVQLSQYIVHLSASEILDTIRHEIAHALDRERRGTSGHDAVWRAVAREVGARPDRLADERASEEFAAATPAPWRIVCDRCGDIGARYRRGKANAVYTHTGCGGRVTFRRSGGAS